MLVHHSLSEKILVLLTALGVVFNLALMLTGFIAGSAFGGLGLVGVMTFTLICVISVIAPYQLGHEAEKRSLKT